MQQNDANLWLAVNILEERVRADPALRQGLWHKLMSAVAPAKTAPLDSDSLATKVKALEEAHAELQKTAARSQREAMLRKKVSIAIGRYFIKGDRSVAYSIPLKDVKAGNSPDWIVTLLKNGKLTDPEHAVLKYFQDPNSTIIDIGANLGYSATSFLQTSTKSKILSFEPNLLHVPSLERLKQLRPDDFDFAPIGLGSKEDDVSFVMPVVDRNGLSALMTADITSVLDVGIPENIVNYTLTYLPDSADPVIQFCEMTWHVERLDHALKTRKYSVPLDDIVAIKIDVEGYELAVLEGARQTLKKHRPLLLLEGANRVAPVHKFLLEMDYTYADFEDERMRLMDKPSSRVNGFYVHKSRVDDYRNIGLLL